jgi:2-C-methyl-D-erythritol 2,4-cyclodiphosphate synthase
MSISLRRSGIGYDAHRFKEGRKLILGGVEIPHPRGLEGHSDADVLSHAIADALLGAIGERDIGHHFPNTDETIRGIRSIEILRRVGEMLARNNCRITNVDATLIAEAPRIGPHLEVMRRNISAALGIDAARVGIKATTNEGMGALGRGEGMAAMAVAGVEQEG